MSIVRRRQNGVSSLSSIFFFAAGFFAAGAFFAAGSFSAVSSSAAFFAVGFFAAVFFAAGFLAGAFLAGFAPPLEIRSSIRRIASSSDTDSSVIDFGRVAKTLFQDT